MPKKLILIAVLLLVGAGCTDTNVDKVNLHLIEKCFEEGWTVYVNWFDGKTRCESSVTR